MAKHIHIHLHSRTTDRKAKDAGFTQYDPREATRLDDQIKRLTQEMATLESKMDVIWKAGGQVTPHNTLQVQYKKLEAELAQVKRERAKYHTNPGDSIGKPYEPDEIDRDGKRWLKTDEMIPFNGKPARKYKEKGGFKYITREVESGVVHDGCIQAKPMSSDSSTDPDVIMRSIERLEEKKRNAKGDEAARITKELEKLYDDWHKYQRTNDSKLEELERQLEELEAQIEKLEDAGQSPSRAQLDKRKELQGAIDVIKSARKAE